MNVTERCGSCLKGLAKTTVELSGGGPDLLLLSERKIDEMIKEGGTPPDMANRILSFIRHVTGVYDPFAARKKEEFDEAIRAVSKAWKTFPSTLHDALLLSALGNSKDFFSDDSHDARAATLHGDMDKIEKAIYNNNGLVLIIGDNPGDFIFDMPLASFLSREGIDVVYAVREHPVQNDFSLPDVERFGLRSIFPNIISTGSGEVGVRPGTFSGRIRELWDRDIPVIAKGMGNYETLSDGAGQRPVIHVMRIKCPAVAEHTGQSVGTYIALLGGE